MDDLQKKTYISARMTTCVKCEDSWKTVFNHWNKKILLLDRNEISLILNPPLEDNSNESDPTTKWQ